MYLAAEGGSASNADEVLAKLTAFFHTLTSRWQRDATEWIIGLPQAPPSFPTGTQGQSPDELQGIWDYTTPGAQFHLHGYESPRTLPTEGSRPVGSTHCAFVRWVQSACHPDTLSSVSCDGRTGAPESGYWQNPESIGQEPFYNEEPMPPRFVECNMGQLLRKVEDWAWNERTQFFRKMPLFGAAKTSELHDAYQSLVHVGVRLALEEVSEDMRLPETDEDLAPGIIGMEYKYNRLYPELRGWTGLAANSYQNNFVSSTRPTMKHQSEVIACLMNGYSIRSGMITKGREDCENLTGWATESLKATENKQLDTGIPEGGWTLITGLGALATAAAFFFTGTTAAAVGAGLKLIGFLGKHSMPEYTTISVDKHEIPEILGAFNSRLNTLNDELDSVEQQYRSGMQGLRDDLLATHRSELELYDFNGNDSGGNHDENGAHPDSTDGRINVDFSGMWLMAQDCWTLSDGYDDLWKRVGDTYVADWHLNGADGLHTIADRLLLEIRDQLESFLKTTAARYFLAGEQLIAALKEYEQADADAATKLENILNKLHSTKIRPELSISANTAAAPTERGDYPTTKVSSHPQPHGRR